MRAAGQVFNLSLASSHVTFLLFVQKVLALLNKKSTASGTTDIHY